ncbi:hypothetical protein DFP98_103186 [Cohnella phaseoli]|uniref:Uncharacterized protein n=1 Tax=Cohnella phaseoli TaxID=456490 RepID=A0A3D9KIF6_9BACL|nr:hypothetical protein DFP98_103186 [Cohnella phaseoli]
MNKREARQYWIFTNPVTNEKEGTKVPDQPKQDRPKGTIFPDMLDNHWVAKDVKLCKAAGIFKGGTKGI